MNENQIRIETVREQARRTLLTILERLEKKTATTEDVSVLAVVANIASDNYSFSKFFKSSL